MNQEQNGVHQNMPEPSKKHISERLEAVLDVQSMSLKELVRRFPGVAEGCLLLVLKIWSDKFYFQGGRWYRYRPEPSY